MIDVSKCVYDETIYNKPLDEDYDCGYLIHYFIYPKDMSESSEFCPEDFYGNVVSMEIAVYDYDDGSLAVYISPTVENEDGVSDVDWCLLYEDQNYSTDDIYSLLNMVPDKIKAINMNSGKTETFKKRLFPRFHKIAEEPNDK